MIALSERLSGPSRRTPYPTGCDHLPYGRGRVRAEFAPLGQVAEHVASREGVRRFAEERRPACQWTLETEHEPDQRCLAAAVRACDPDELPLFDAQIDIAQDGRTGCVGESQVAELDRRLDYRQFSAFRSAARFSRMTEK
jgi:hypothetical protein